MADAPTSTPAQPPDFGRKLKDGAAPLLLAVVQTSLVAWFGLQITGKLDLALKERQVTLESAKAIAGLVERMQVAGATERTYRETALKLAMFGDEAVQPLVFMAAAPGPYSEDIPLEGLKLISVLHKASVCQALRSAANAKDAIDGARYKGIEKTRSELQC